MISHHTANGSNASRNADPSHQSMSQSHWRQGTSKLVKVMVVYVSHFIFHFDFVRLEPFNIKADKSESVPNNLFNLDVEEHKLAPHFPISKSML